MTIRVLIADDHKILRDGLVALLEEQEDLRIVAQADNGREAIALTRQHRPDIVVMDAAMPLLNGVEATRQIHAESPGVRIIALSMHSDRRFVRGMLAAGASGYLLKDSAVEELVLAVRTVARGQVYLSPGIGGALVQDYQELLAADASEKRDPLSPREREVLQLLAEGHTTKQVAALLHVSVKTVETHRKNIMDRLGLRSIAELTKYAIREGLTSLEG